jgi:AAA family ATP:ADP antiporter
MFREKVIKEFLSFTRMERFFILSAMFCGFLITAEYAIIRPVANSVFIHTYGSEWFPYAWMVAIPVNFLIVLLYNRYLPKLGCWRMFLVSIGVIACGSLCSAFFLKKLFFLPFGFYVWKEVYVMMLFQLLWSVIHSTIKMDRAKYLYGMLFAVGGAGGAFGSMIPSFLAVKLGSEHLLFLSLPIYFLLTIAYFFLLKNSSAGVQGVKFEEHVKKTLPPIRHSLQMVFGSRVLTFILLTVVFIQLSATIIDYQFNTILAQEFPLKDIRTAYAGKVLGIMNMVTVVFQCLGSFLLVHYLGIKRSHFLIPILLCSNALAFAFFPVFGMISFAYVTIKSVDFSIFGVIKEMLYIPLKIDEKFRAKAVIDVFVHRAAKAFASLLILGIQFVPSIHALSFLSWANVTVFALWCLVVFNFFREKESAVDKATT